MEKHFHYWETHVVKRFLERSWWFQFRVNICRHLCWGICINETSHIRVVLYIQFQLQVVGQGSVERLRCTAGSCGLQGASAGLSGLFTVEFLSMCLHCWSCSYLVIVVTCEV